MVGLVIYCDYAQDFEEGEPCPHTGKTDCLKPEICPMIESGMASVIESGVD